MFSEYCTIATHVGKAREFWKNRKLSLLVSLSSFPYVALPPVKFQVKPTPSVLTRLQSLICRLISHVGCSSNWEYISSKLPLTQLFCYGPTRLNSVLADTCDYLESDCASHAASWGRLKRCEQSLKQEHRSIAVPNSQFNYITDLDYK